MNNRIPTFYLIALNIFRRIYYFKFLCKIVLDKRIIITKKRLATFLSLHYFFIPIQLQPTYITLTLFQQSRYLALLAVLHQPV